MDGDADLQEAVARLHRAPHDEFVAERKRLADERKRAGDKAGAAVLMKRARPALSAWVVNQLWWHARDDFDELFASAERLRHGELDATRSHREAVASLRARAGELLAAGGHAVTDAVLRRVTTTLSALAAIGSFDPDAPGTLTVDRDPPGFGVIGLAIPAAGRPPVPALAPDEADEGADRFASRRRQVEAERARAEAERVRFEERQRCERDLRLANAEVETKKLDLSLARDALAAAERKLEHARATAAELQAKLSKLE